MTGYARAEGREGQVSWVWEAKSVNGRSLEVRLRLPAGHDGLDPVAREAVAALLKRGNVQLSLTVSRNTDASATRINTALLDQLAGVVADMSARHPHVGPLTWDGLLNVKGVLEAGEPEEADGDAVKAELEAAMTQSLKGAVAQLAAMRRSEGARIQAVLEDQLASVSDLAGKAADTAALRPEAVRERLRAQMAAVLEVAPSLHEDRIAQEVALLAVKADVREEVDRLRAHVAAARELLAAGGAVGRKLDFLSQEFNREANTLCSKALDVDLTRIGLDLKAVIDQFREQVQNIE
jgi:uncharacterized protein (TIGR00255 family)